LRLIGEAPAADDEVIIDTINAAVLDMPVDDDDDDVETARTKECGYLDDSANEIAEFDESAE
jgi:hypothetical protein